MPLRRPWILGLAALLAPAFVACAGSQNAVGTPSAGNAAPAVDAGADSDSGSGSDSGSDSGPDVLASQRAQRDGLLRLAAARPDDGVVLYTLATTHAGLGELSEAAALLEKLDVLGWDVPPDPEDFPGLVTHPAFRALTEQTRARTPPVARAKVAFRLADRGLIPEGIAYDAKTDRFFVGSLRKRTLLRVTRTGAAEPFGAAGLEPALGVLGLRVDEGRRSLWVALAKSRKDPRATAPASSLVELDVDTGAKRRRIDLEGAAGEHLLNDVAVARDGTAFVTDSETGAVLKVAPAAARFETVLAPGTFTYPNGIAVDGARGRLYVAAWDGIYTLPVAGGKPERLKGPRGALLGGLDGLYFAASPHEGDRLLAVQNGLGAPRIVLFPLAADGSSVTRLDVLESAHEDLVLPTTAALAKGALFVLAHTELRAFTGDDTAFDEAKLHAPTVLEVPLPNTKR